MKNNQTLSLLLSKAQIDTLKQTYRTSLVSSNNPYMDVMIQIDGCTLSIYNSKKVVFQGPLALEMATLLGYQKITFSPHIGSDEVGTGDYFGPVCVCAAYVDETIAKQVESLGIKDSKQLTDTMIVGIASQLKDIVPHSLLILDNKRYNIIHQTNNMNKIKAKLHNQAIAHLLKKIKGTPTIIVDQFSPEKQYYGYLNEEKTIIKNITFETKAENKYLGVAIGAIFARAAFVEAFYQLEKQLGMPLPKGAGVAVDSAAAAIVNQHGWPTLEKVAKMHFKNTVKVQEQLKADD
jgi:ribonuclease HIII